MARQIDYRDKKGLKQRKEIEEKIGSMTSYEMYAEFNLRGLGGSSVPHASYDENEKYSYVAPSEVRDKLINSMEEDLPETTFQRNQRKRKGDRLM